MDTTNFINVYSLSISLDANADLYVSTGGPYTLPNLRKLDANDNLLWSYNNIFSCGSSPASIGGAALDSKQNVIIAGTAGCGICYATQIDPLSNAYIAKLRPNGDTVFNYYSPYCGAVYSFALQDDDHIIALLTGRIDTTLELVSFDSLGHIEWTIPMPFPKASGQVLIDAAANIILGMSSQYSNPAQDTASIYNKVFIEVRKYGTNYINGIDEIAASHHIRVYPNPAKDIVTIRSDAAEIEQIEITDVQGHLVFSQSLNATATGIPVGNLAKGLYILSVRTDDTYRYKILVD
jgi:hypothetical protein